MNRPNWKLWLKDKKECRAWFNQYKKKDILKISGDDLSLYIKKTNHNLNLANWLFEKHKDEIPNVFGDECFYDWIINIYYYAIYHSALALLSKKGYNSKNHSATLCFLINRYYHDTKSLDKNDIFFIADSLDYDDFENFGFSKELREKASYDVNTVFEKDLALQMKEKTINFINKIKNMIV